MADEYGDGIRRRTLNIPTNGALSLVWTLCSVSMREIAVPIARSLLDFVPHAVIAALSNLF